MVSLLKPKAICEFASSNVIIGMSMCVCISNIWKPYRMVFGEQACNGQNRSWCGCVLVQRSVTFPRLGKVFPFNSQTFSNETFLSKRFSGNKSFFKVNSPLILKCVWFGLLVSFWFFQTWSDLGFSADRSLWDWIVFQAGWSLVSFTPWAFGQDHLNLGCADSTRTPSPSIPLVHQLSLVSPLEPFMMFYVFISALQILWWEESPWNTRLLLLLLIIDAGLGATLGGY